MNPRTRETYDRLGSQGFIDSLSKSSSKDFHCFYLAADAVHQYNGKSIRLQLCFEDCSMKIFSFSFEDYPSTMQRLSSCQKFCLGLLCLITGCGCCCCCCCFAFGFFCCCDCCCDHCCHHCCHPERSTRIHHEQVRTKKKR